MAENLTAKAAVAINASPDRVWKALTDPAMIKEYLFGTEAVSDWKKGSTITYSGVWKGKPYEDKGVIVDIEPEKRLHSTFYSPLSGKEDIPENYANVVYELSEQAGQTLLQVTQDNNDSDAARQDAAKTWHQVLEGLKQLVEKSVV